MLRESFEWKINNITYRIQFDTQTVLPDSSFIVLYKGNDNVWKYYNHPENIFSSRPFHVNINLVSDNVIQLTRFLQNHRVEFPENLSNMELREQYENYRRAVVAIENAFQPVINLDGDVRKLRKSRRKSPRRKSPRRKLSRRKLSRRKSSRRKSSRRKSSRRKSSRRKSLKRKS